MTVRRPPCRPKHAVTLGLFDDVIMDGRRAGKTLRALGAEIGCSFKTVENRANVINAPVPPRGVVGMDAVQADTYRLYIRKGFHAAEARAAALGAS